MSHTERVQSIICSYKQLCKKSLGNDLVALYLRGSYSRGDWAPGLSDLDFYVVLRDTVLDASRTKSDVEERLNIMLKKAREANPELDMSLRYDIESDALVSGCDGFITSRDSKLLLGTDVLREVPSPSLDELKDYGKRMVIRLCDDWVEAEKARKVPQSLEDAANGAQYMILKIAQNALFAKGLLKFSKKDIATTFQKQYEGFDLKRLVQEAYDIRLKWDIVRHDSEKLESFIKNALTFPQAFKSHMANSR